MREAFAGYRKRTAGLILLALALRLCFVFAFPHSGGDSPVYEAFAINLLEFGVYSHAKTQDYALPRPTMIRCPGYPLMLAAVFAAAGRNNETAVRILQASLDTFTCLLVALLVFELAGGEIARRRVLAQWALFLAAICPFVANYSASILTEVPTTLFLAGAALYGLRALRHRAAARDWLYCGLLTGAANLFRPESAILLGAFGIALFFREAARRAWKPVLVGGCVMAAGLALPLLPWTVRNLVTMRTFQPLAPFYAQDQGERVPIGYLEWCKTWLWTYRDVNLYLFPLEEYSIPTDSLPSGASDGDRQRQEILGLIKRHNEDFSLDEETDNRFEAIAGGRRRLHPLRYCIMLPALRALALWFTPRYEILPLEGRLLPLRDAWENDPRDVSFTFILFLVNLAYVAIAFRGVVKVLRQYKSFENPEFLGCFTLLAIIFTRTIFFAYFTFPEPRFVLETYPEVIALAAFAFGGVGKLISDA